MEDEWVRSLATMDSGRRRTGQLRVTATVAGARFARQGARPVDPPGAHPMRRAVALLVLPFLVSAAPRDWDARFREISSTEYAWRQKSFAEPEGTGLNRIMSPHLPDVSPAVQDQRTATWEKVEAELATIPQDRLTAENRVNFAVYKGQIDALLDQQRFKEWQKPANSDSSFWGDLANLDDKPLRSEQEYRNYLARLAEVPRYFDQQVENMKAGEARGFAPPKVTLEGRDISIATIAEAKRAEDTGFWAPFKAMPNTVPADRQEALRAEARQAIMANVVPAYAKLLSYWRSDYVPHANPELAAEKLPGGAAYYRSKIREFTTLDLTPDQIHAIGLAEVASIHAEMLGVMKQVGFKGGFAASSSICGPIRASTPRRPTNCSRTRRGPPSASTARRRPGSAICRAAASPSCRCRRRSRPSTLRGEGATASIWSTPPTCRAGRSTS